MKEKVKKAIMLLLIVVVLCIIIIYIYNKNKKDEIEDYSKDSEGIDIQIEEKANQLEYEKNKNIYYTTIKIIENYIDNVLNGNTEELLNILDYEYIKENNINEENILDILKIETLEEYNYINYIANANYSISNNTVTTHFIYGYYYPDSNITNKIELNLMLELDSINQTFNIYPYSYMVKNNYEKLELGDSIQNTKKSIENRGSNSFDYINITEEEMIEKYIKDYANKVLFDTDSAYATLDEAYLEKKFGSREEFNKYINNKKVEIYIANITQYEARASKDGNNIYACKDQNNNYYYFTETNGVMNYKIKLDNYTIPDEEQINKYTSMDEKAKVIYNINKFINSINDKSYYYAYNCLSDGFKNNYFKSIEDFERYINETLYSNNEIQYVEFEEKSELCTYRIRIVNADNKDEMIEKTIVMKLNEGTDFEMSFNVN